MSKQGKALLSVGIICAVGFMIVLTIGLIRMPKCNNQTKNPPEVNIVEQDIKEYILDHCHKSNISLTYIRKEKISDTCVVYYFELEEGLYLEEHDVWKTYYVKAIYKYCVFTKVLRSNYSEAVVEEDDNEND